MTSLSSSTSTKRTLIKKRKEPSQLPSDVLEVIRNKLDNIDDLLSYGQVSKSWRILHSNFWHDFMASHAPLILQKTPCAKRAFSFYSIIDGRTYNTWLPYFPGFSFLGFSSGYMVMVMVSKDTFVLINPFSRKMIKFPGPSDQGNIKASYKGATLGFVRDSEEFILVAFSPSNMHVYESRNSHWVIYRKDHISYWKIKDVAIFRNGIYAISATAQIFMVMLNSQYLKFHPFINRPRFATACKIIKKLVSSDDELLVVCFEPSSVQERLEIYKIDLSTMAWIRVKTLGDRALFLNLYSKSYSLSNPGMWGFENNCVYCISRTSPVCKVFSLDNDQVIRTILIPENRGPLRAKLRNVDWCFRPWREVVDYSNLQ